MWTSRLRRFRTSRRMLSSLGDGCYSSSSSSSSSTNKIHPLLLACAMVGGGSAVATACEPEFMLADTPSPLDEAAIRNLQKQTAMRSSEEAEEESSFQYESEDKTDAPTTWQAYCVATSASSPAKEDAITKTSSSPQLSRRRTHTVTTEKMYFVHNSHIRNPEKFVFLAGPASTDLGHDIASCLLRNTTGKPNAMEISAYADGETKVHIGDSVRGKNVFVVQSTTSGDALIQLLILIPTLRRASAKKVTVVIPYYGYGRQDQRHQRREPIAAADMARMLEDVGVDRVICMDLHSDTLLGFFSPHTPVEHILPSPVAAAYFHEQIALPTRTEKKDGIEQDTTSTEKKTNADDPSKPSKKMPPITIVASHEGQVERATQFRQAFSRMVSGLEAEEIELAVLIKNSAGNQTSLVGSSVQGRKCILVDDIVNTGTTMEKNITTLAAAGADSIYAWATHGVFTPQALDMFAKNDDLEFMLVSNSTPFPEPLPEKIRVLNLAPLLAEVIARVNHNESLRGLLKRDKNKPAEKKIVHRYDG